MNEKKTIILDEFWYTDGDSILFFDKTKEECKQCLLEILTEYADLIERMKYV